MIRNGETVSLEPHPVRPEPELVGLFQVQQKISEKKILIVNHVNVHFNAVIDPLQSENSEETENVIKELLDYISVDKKINEVDRISNLEKNFDDMMRRMESYEVDIIRLKAVNAAKDTELVSLRDQLQVCSEVKDVEIARITDQVRVLTAKIDSLSAQSKEVVNIAAQSDCVPAASEQTPAPIADFLAALPPPAPQWSAAPAPGRQQPAVRPQQPAPGPQQPAPGLKQPGPGPQQAAPGSRQPAPGPGRTIQITDIIIMETLPDPGIDGTRSNHSSLLKSLDQ